MSSDYVLDDIVQEVSQEQWKKVAELWRRLDLLTHVPGHQEDDSTVATLAGQAEELRWANTKQMRKALGSLTQSQLDAALRRNVKHDDPDTLLVRFLRAHAWNVDAAQVAMFDSVRWRVEEDIFALAEGGDGQLQAQATQSGGEEQKVAKEVLAQFESGQSFLHGTDKFGTPVQYLRVRLHDPSMQGEKAFIKASIMDTEAARMILRPPHTAVSVVFDMNGFGMSNMDMKALKLGSSGLQDHFPEALAHIYVLSAPWIVNGIWSMVKSWLPAAIQSKVHFVKNVKALGEFIPLDRVPKSVGGSSEWGFKWIEPALPQPLDAAEQEKKANLLRDREALLDEHTALTREWVSKVGSDEAGALLDKRRSVVQKLRQNYWQLDPLVRGRIQLDRAGKLGDGGKVDMMA